MARYTLLIVISMYFVVATTALQPLKASAAVSKPYDLMHPGMGPLLRRGASLLGWRQVEAVHQPSNRKLLFEPAGWGQRMANNQRASIATSQAIDAAVDDGASLRSTRRAATVGDAMTWAAAQNDQRTFDMMERVMRMP